MGMVHDAGPARRCCTNEFWLGDGFYADLATGGDEGAGTGNFHTGLYIDGSPVALLASPGFTGNPTAPTQATADNSTKLATTAYVQSQGYITGLTLSGLTATFSAPFSRSGNTLSLLYDSNFGVNGSNQLDLAAIPSGELLGNSGGSSAEPGPTTLSSLIDRALGSAQGDILYRGSSGWGALAPGNAGQHLQSGGGSANPSWITPAINAGYFSQVSTTQVEFCPANGAAVVIAGAVYPIPSGCVTAANTSVLVNGSSGNLAASTQYLVAIYNNAGTPTLAFFASASYSHMPDTTAGNVGTEVISSSGTPQSNYTLVGLVVTDASSHFQAQGVGTISWFNRVNLRVIGLGTGSVTSGTLAEITSSARINYVSWLSEAVVTGISGYMSNATGGDGASAQINRNGTVGQGDPDSFTSATGGNVGPLGGSVGVATTSEGTNYMTLFGANITGGTASFTFDNYVMVRG